MKTNFGPNGTHANDSSIAIETVIVQQEGKPSSNNSFHLSGGNGSSGSGGSQTDLMTQAKSYVSKGYSPIPVPYMKKRHLRKIGLSLKSHWMISQNIFHAKPTSG